MATSYQTYTWPPISATATSPSNGTIGSVIPSVADLMGAEDPSLNLQPLQVDSSKNLKVSISASSATVSTSDAANGPVTAGTVASKSELIGGQYNSSLPTLTTGQQAALQTDSSARLLVGSIASALPAGSNTVGNVNQAGTWTVQPGNTANTTPWLATINQGGNSATVTGSNALKVDGSAVTQPVSAASLPLPTGAATETTLAKLALAQASSTASEVGPLVQGATTTAAPTYTTGTTNPLSLTTAGALRVDPSATTQPVSGTVTSNQGSANATPWNQNIAQVGGSAVSLGQKVSASSIPIVVASDQSNLPIQQKGRAFANAPVLNNYGTTSVTTSAYTQLIASTTSAANLVEVFDSSGQAMILAVGAASSEVIQFYVFPGGQGQVPLSIPSGSRVAIKALTANATSGILILNLYT